MKKKVTMRPQTVAIKEGADQYRCRMAQETNLAHLARELEIPVTHLSITCIFCNKTVQKRELLQFVYKDLKVVWRKQWPYVTCVKCLAVKTRISAWRGYEGSGDVTAVERDTGTPFGDLVVRCIVCVSKLTALEKIDMVSKGRKFHKVYGNYRGICCTCSSDPAVVSAVSQSTVGILEEALQELRDLRRL